MTEQKSWTYSQTSGELRDPAGGLVETGYSGAKPFVNVAKADRLEDRGPIPDGVYTIGAEVDHDTCGPCSLPLDPDPGNQMYGRTAFLIHGDTPEMNQSASTGCVIMSRATRDMISASDCRTLVVTI